MNSADTNIYSAFFMEGLRDLNYDDVLASWDNGAVELVSELCSYATSLDHMVNAAIAARDDSVSFPGVLDYEVCAPFGQWFGKKVLENPRGDTPSNVECIQFLQDAVTKFFQQGESTDRQQNIARAVAEIGFINPNAEKKSSPPAQMDAANIHSTFEPAFDMKAYCLNMALGQFLSNWNDDRQSEVLDAMMAGDDDLMEELDVTVWDPVSDYPSSAVARFIEDAAMSFESNIKHVMQITNAAQVDFYDDVRRLCASIERGDPNDIADEWMKVKAGLPIDDEDEDRPSIAP